MPKIKKLDPQEIIKIAAGEVIERPVNVIKEVVENAIDAQATQISLYIEDGGKKLIQIVDNGIGMSKEDAILSIEHHATSKLQTVHDLDKILTFGFRGEALSSITSVSKVRLITKEDHDLTATELEICGGEMVQIKTVSANTGTTLIIEDLFFNVPVRKKFLKSKDTELRAILHLFHAFCFSNLATSFKLFVDKKQLYNCPGVKSIKERLEQLYDQNLTDNTIVIENADDINNLRLTGIVTKPSYNRYDRNQIFTFVNNRWVKNYKLTQALIKAYQGALQPDKFPAGFLFLTVNPKDIDINIHPKKEEVQFLHPRIIEHFITKAVKEGLDNAVKQSISPLQPSSRQVEKNSTLSSDFNSFKPTRVIPSVQEKEDVLANNSLSSNDAHQLAFNTILNTYFDPSQSQPSSSERIPDEQNLKQPSPLEPVKIIQEPFLPTQYEITKPQSASLALFNQTETITYKVIGQLFNTYIIIENNNELVFIDQHAAHERVIYEKIKHSSESPQPINLLIQQIITLSPKELIILEPYLSLLQDQGIIAELFGKDKLRVKALPHYLKNQKIDDIVKQTIALIEHNSNIQELKIQIQDDLHKQMSCKAAVKAGDTLTQEAMQNIINELYKCPHTLTCPHGRPTVWSLGKTEIEKKFKRDYKGKMRSSIFDNE